MPSAITETPTKGTPISAPVGADLRTAASVRTPFQAVGNRLAFLEAFYDAFFSALTFVANATWTIADGKTFKIQGDQDLGNTGVLDLRLVNLLLAGNTRGALVLNGNTGRVPKKYVHQTAAGSISPLVSDWVGVHNSAPITLVILDTDHSQFVNGEHITFVYNSSGGTVTINNEAGSFLASLTVTGQWVTFVWNPGTNTWDTQRGG